MMSHCACKIQFHSDGLDTDTSECLIHYKIGDSICVITEEGRSFVGKVVEAEHHRQTSEDGIEYDAYWYILQERPDDSQTYGYVTVME